MNIDKLFFPKRPVLYPKGTHTFNAITRAPFVLLTKLILTIKNI